MKKKYVAAQTSISTFLVEKSVMGMSALPSQKPAPGEQVDDV